MRSLIMRLFGRPRKKRLGATQPPGFGREVEDMETLRLMPDDLIMMCMMLGYLCGIAAVDDVMCDVDVLMFVEFVASWFLSQHNSSKESRVLLLVYQLS